jgi:dolichyl-phosphate mannosyltransferase polypeptide 2 regulatory subunit
VVSRLINSVKAVSDKIFGGAMLFTASVVFVYYTVWAILLVRSPLLDPPFPPLITSFDQPLIEKSSPIHDFFPSREWAVRLPAFVLVASISAVGIFVGTTIVQENRRKAEKAKLRTA